MTLRVLALLAVCLGGCRAVTPQVVYPGTEAYEQRVASFELSPEAASKLAGGYFGKEGPACVIDDWYVFSRPYKEKRVDLRGTYVNGRTGAVEQRESELSLLGDNSILGMFRPFPASMPDSVSEAVRVGRLQQ